MTDLILAGVAVGVLSAGMFLLGRWLGRRPSRWPGVAALVFCAAAFGVYLLWLRDSVALLWVVPVSAVPVLGDPTPWLAALAAGVVWAQGAVHLARRGVLGGAVVVAGWYGPADLFTRRPPLTQASWADGVCLQSTGSTCGPAACATLLQHHGVEATEAEMAALCLTSGRGTHLTGLYRGLTIKAPDGMRVVARADRVDDLIAHPERLPAVVSLVLTRTLADTDPRYEEEWGWDVGVMHSVVLLGFEENNRVLIADPGAGREYWSERGLRELWAGEALYLARDE